jgi:acyl transferase domain-containing protein/NAD(P)-dependent dehydrogenase (short-subunit alcohol dehydrogenase family)/acyl carrier protein
MKTASDQAIAIVGVGAIMPDAMNAAAFWQNILHKRYSISDTPPERWSIADYYDPDPKAPDKTYSKIGGWVRGFEFDWKRFRMPPKVAAAMDEGQQWALTVAADTLADYGYPERPLNTDRTAVILGTAMGGELHYITTQRIVFPEYVHALEDAPQFAQLPAGVRQAIVSQWHANIDRQIPPITEDSMPGELPNIVSGRVANVLNLRGPNYITDAACASSFAAVEAGVQLLVEHKVDAVLTGGIDRNMGAASFVKFCKIGALSASGTRPFGDGADGFVMGEGAACFLLKRLADAERAGDKIYAVIRGIGGASDGKGKGITAPNPIGQHLAMRRAWEAAGLDPATASLIEAHGTSTRVGDVVEVESLNEVFGGASRHSIALGSVKSNIGHLKAGAGAAGLFKAVMALHDKVLPPTLNAEEPNPNIAFEETPFYLVHEARDWQPDNGAPRRCGVSAYGFGGTNFHIVLEEHVPGLLQQERPEAAGQTVTPSSPHPVTPSPLPVRGILSLGAATPAGLQEKLAAALARVETGWTPPIILPPMADLQAQERLFIDFGDHAELLDRLQKARKVMGIAKLADTPQAWQAMQAQGIFRGSGRPAGKIAFLFPGQGSQYVNMGRELTAVSPIVAQVFAAADRVMTPILGRPLTDYLFVDPDDAARMGQAQFDLMQTEITQPAMLTLDIAILRLLQAYGFEPDVVMGHSLGEYAALIAAGVMPFADALEAAAARGGEMSKVNIEDKGMMAAVLAPYEVVEFTLAAVGGYVVPANINSHSQCVIGGASEAVQRAVQRFREDGYEAMLLPVSHAFHTSIVAPASQPLRQVLNRLRFSPPSLPLVANVTGDFYPSGIEDIKDLLQQQVAAPVQWVKGLETLYAHGVRTFLEVGPKRALRSFANNVFADKDDVLALITNHPKMGELPTFNQALCGLYAAGYGPVNGDRYAVNGEQLAVASGQLPVGERAGGAAVVQKDVDMKSTTMSNGQTAVSVDQLSQVLAQALQRLGTDFRPAMAYDRNAPPAGSVVVSGTGLGLPGPEKPVMDPDNALRILRGEQFIDLIPERFRRRMVNKRITRLVKSADGNGRFETISDPDEVIKLAGRAGSFDLAEEYGVPTKLVEALDITTQLALAAGLDALREAGIPLVQTYRRTTNHKLLPNGWQLPAALQDETGVIFASAFPGGDRFAEDFERFYTYQSRLGQLHLLEELRQTARDDETLLAINCRANELRETLAREPYIFDRRFIFRILAMGHSQFAEYIGARGPNTQVNVACASTTQAIAIAEDWIRAGRCRRVIVIAADNVTGDHLLEWVGAGFLALGAAATDDQVSEAAVPFDKRRHGTILGMGACALVIESEDAVRERGMRGIVELLSSESRNSAYHGSRLDVDHIAGVMDDLVTAAERRFGINRQAVASELVFMSHETFTPARGGSASAEVFALRHTFGRAANDIVIANTKGFTGHPMGVGVEDVIAIKTLEHGIVPPVPNYKEADPELGTLNLSRGGRYPVQYALHLAAGFGSQIAFSLTRRIPGNLDRIDHKAGYQQWLDSVSGYDRAETEVVKRVLRVVDQGLPPRSPAAGTWQYGTGPVVRAEQYSVFSKQHSVGPEPVVARPVVASEKLIVESDKLQVAGEKSQVASPLPVTDNRLPITGNGSPSTDPIADRILAIVAEQTGYPTDMLELDLDMEADLGVDTVKQAETFLAIREAFDIPQQENLQLRDYPTLGHVIEFVGQMRPDLSSDPLPVNGEPITADRLPITDNRLPATDPIADRILAIVAEQTGYPTDMLELDLDLEADLGVDTVKQAETFLAIREAFDIPQQENLQLRDYPTLGHVIEFVGQMRPDLRGDPLPVVGEPITADRSPITDNRLPATDPIAARILAIVAEQTGYPTDMLELDLDLEADLGVDTVKQAETFLAIREAFDIPQQENLQLRDYPTLGHVIEFVGQMRPDLRGDPLPVDGEPITADRPPITANWPRRVPVATLRPSLDLCLPTGVALDEKSRVVVALDQGGVGRALANRLEKLGVTVLTVNADATADSLQNELQSWLADGSIQGVYWLPALDVEPDLTAMTPDEWRELNRVRVKNLALSMRTLYAQIKRAGTFLVAATRLGGLHGYGPDGATAPLGGAVTGFSKAYKREQNEVMVKAVDFAIGSETADLADALIAETVRDAGVVEVGYHNEQRFTVSLLEQPLSGEQPGLTLNNETVFLVTGAAGGITSAIVADLAQASGGIFYLLDLVEAPAAADPHVALFRSDKEALKQQFIEAAKAAGEKVTPVVIEKKLMAVERAEAARRAIEAVEAAGGTAVYRSANLLDGPALAAVVAEIRQKYGRIDVLIHACGLEISRSLDKKETAEFDLVYDVKADGLFNLLHAAGEMPIAAVVSFSSVAGRFGNAGQTDYSAANDLLCKLTSSLRRWRPETRGLAIDWTAWGDIGMATRGSTPKIMAMAGIEMLPPAVGIPTVRRELAASSFSGEIVVAGSLGLLAEEWHETGGLDPAAVKTGEPLLGQVQAFKLYGDLQVKTTLDPNRQPFLYDHALEGTPLLPGVMGTEMFAQLAAVLAPDYRVTAVENETFHAAFKFYRMEPQTLYLAATAVPDGDDLLVYTGLRSRRELKTGEVQEKLHFSATVRLSRAESTPPTTSFTPPAELPIDREAVYRVYFHGPAYKVLAGVQVDGPRAVGLMAGDLPAHMEPAATPELIAPRLIELCFQTAGIWEAKTKGVLALPQAIGAVMVYGQEAEANAPLYAVVEAVNGGSSFSAQVVDKSGKVYVEMVDYRTVQLPVSVTL